MGLEKKSNKQRVKAEVVPNKQVEDEKKNVNLLHVYTIYKQKLRRLTKEEFDKLLGLGADGKPLAFKLCKEFMKAKNVHEDVSFERNIGFLSFPRFLPMVALLAERSEYKITPSIVSKLDFCSVSERFKEKFSQLMVYGFWFLGRVIKDSLSEKEQVNRGNIFNFDKGDMGYWWAGVRILDWNQSIHKEESEFHLTCYKFIIADPPKYRFFSSRAVHNMGQHPLYFLSDNDWANFYHTVKAIRHMKMRAVPRCANLSFPFSTSDDSSDIVPSLDDWERSIYNSDTEDESKLSTFSLGSISCDSHQSIESVD